MDINAISIIGGVLVLVILIFIARKVLRLAIKLMLVGLVVIALLVGAGLGWWNGWFGSASPTKPQHRIAPARPTAPR